jgi:curli biogenesis system outer membrane secretion channel CsgG
MFKKLVPVIALAVIAAPAFAADEPAPAATTPATHSSSHKSSHHSSHHSSHKNSSHKSSASKSAPAGDDTAPAK